MFLARIRAVVTAGSALASVLVVGTGSALAAVTAAPPVAPPPASPVLPPDVAIAAGAPPLPAQLGSASWLVADLGSGTVLAARAGSAKRAPASTLKILTALTFTGDSTPPDLTADASDVATTGSRAGLRPGGRYRTVDLLDALFVASGNDVARLLARAAGDGSDPAAAMNAAARRLGALDTTAAGPTGLDAAGQLTTAFDLAVLTRAALARPDIRRAAGLPATDLTTADGGGRRHHLVSTNPLLGRYPGALGVKTGSTTEAGRTFVGAAERNGRTIAVVLLQAPRSYGTEAAALLDWGFSVPAGVTPLALLPPAGAAPPTGAATATADAAHVDPPAVAPAEDGGGISPLLALALALTVVAGAFTYWRGREQPPGQRATGEPAAPPRPAEEPFPADGQSPAVRDPRSLFAP